MGFQKQQSRELSPDEEFIEFWRACRDNELGKATKLCRPEFLKRTRAHPQYVYEQASRRWMFLSFVASVTTIIVLGLVWAACMQGHYVWPGIRTILLVLSLLIYSASHWSVQEWYWSVGGLVFLSSVLLDYINTPWILHVLLAGSSVASVVMLVAGVLPTQPAEEDMGDVDIYLERQYVNTTALRIASEKGNVDISRMLLYKGADPNGRSGNYYAHEETALHGAVMHGHLEVVRLLLDNDGDANAHAAHLGKGDGDTALLAALHMLPEASAVPAMLRPGREDDWSDEGDFVGDEEPREEWVAREILDQPGIDVNKWSYARARGAVACGPETALHLAVKKGRASLVRQLITQHAVLDAVSPALDERNEGTEVPLLKTPLHHAIELDMVVITRVLLKYGADPNIRTEDGRTAFDLAARKGGEMSHLLGQYLTKKSASKKLSPMR